MYIVIYSVVLFIAIFCFIVKPFRRKEAKMNAPIFTGYTKSEFTKEVKKGKKFSKCYSCHRESNDMSVISTELGIQYIDMPIINYEIQKKDGDTFIFPLCLECKTLLSSFTMQCSESSENRRDLFNPN